MIRPTSLRAKIWLACLLIVLCPLLVAWALGLYEAYVRHTTARDLERIGDQLSQSWDSYANQPGPLARYCGDHSIYIRIVDPRGVLQAATDPALAEDRLRGWRWYERLEDWYFAASKEKPPELLDYERRLPPLAERPEIASALAGVAANAVREPAPATMVVFYRAVPLPGVGALYLTRLSRRSIRELYDLRYQMLKLTVWLLVVATIIALWVGRHVVRPLSIMQRGVDAYLTRGERTSVALPRGDEIGELSRGFDALIRNLEARLGDTTRLAADLAHDLKSPLSTVAASSELMEGSVPLDGERRQRIARALAEAAEHMRRSLDALLALARLEEALATEARRGVDVVALCERVADSARLAARRSTVSLRREGAAGAVVLGIEARLEQMLRNLVDNAQAFCGSQVRITIAAEGQDVIIDVEDDGPGVSPGNRDKIFRRFFSARPVGSEPGTGLGLVNARAIAEAHHGSVSLAETGDLGGARFRVRLPRHVPAGAPPLSGRS